MRTTISIDAGMLRELVEATGARSGSAALNEAAAEYLRQRKRQALKAAWQSMRTADVKREAAVADRRRERFLDGLS